MRTCRFGFVLLGLLFFGVALSAQQPATQTLQSPQAVAILRQSLGVLAKGTVISDVNLTGTADWVAGSDNETGNAALKALAAGDARVDLSLPSGQRSEVSNNAGSLQNVPAGQWTGPDGKAHAMSSHNLLTDPSWFFPAMTLNRWVSNPGYFVSLVGQESWNGATVNHLTVYLLATALGDNSALFQHLSQMDIYLDSASELPVALAFNIHPDDNALLDIPVQIRYSDYRSVNGAQVAFHVEKYLNNTLTLDLHFDAVTLNSGLSVSNFQVQ
jgi:hypothetical protein